MSDQNTKQEPGRIFRPTYKHRSGEMRQSPHWYIQYFNDGKRYKESSHSTDRRVAVRLLKKRLGECGVGRHFPSLDRLRFSDYSHLIVQDQEQSGCAAVGRTRINLRRLNDFFGSARLTDINRLAGDYIETRSNEVSVRGTPVAKATILGELGTLKRILRLAAEKNLIPYVPVLPTIRGARAKREGYLKESELAALLTELPDDIRAATHFAYLTGWRLQEVLGLQWCHVDFEEGVVRLDRKDTKNREGGVFPFDVLPELKALLLAQRARADAIQREYRAIVTQVFCRDDGRRILYFRRTWETACERAGKPGFHFHDLRRSACRNLLRSGLDEKQVMLLMRHKSRSMLDWYNIIDEDDLREGVAKHAARLARS